MTNTKEELLHCSEPKKRVSNAYANRLRTFSKTDVRYWRERILKPRYQQGGQAHEAPNWAVEIQYRDLKSELGDHFEGRSYPGWRDRVLALSTELRARPTPPVCS